MDPVTTEELPVGPARHWIDRNAVAGDSCGLSSWRAPCQVVSAATRGEHQNRFSSPRTESCIRDVEDTIHLCGDFVVQDRPVVVADNVDTEFLKCRCERLAGLDTVSEGHSPQYPRV